MTNEVFLLEHFFTSQVTAPVQERQETTTWQWMPRRTQTAGAQTLAGAQAHSSRNNILLLNWHSEERPRNLFSNVFTYNTNSQIFSEIDEQLGNLYDFQFLDGIRHSTYDIHFVDNLAIMNNFCLVKYSVKRRTKNFSKMFIIALVKANLSSIEHSSELVDRRWWYVPQRSKSKFLSGSDWIDIVNKDQRNWRFT